MRKVQFTETVLRDANQSLIATRLPYSKFEPILETMDKAPAQDPQEDAQHQAADAAPGPEHPGL